MEFDIEKNKVVGIIDHPLKYGGARIKVIGYLNLERNLVLLNEEDLKIEFPPIGFIFGYKFFIDNNLVEGDLIEFKIEDAQNEKDHGDSYRIQRDSKVKLWGRRIFEVENFNINNSFVELSKISIPTIDYTHSFYVYSNNKIYGKLKLQKSSIIPDNGHYFYEWLKEQCEIFTYKDNHYLLDDQPKEHYNNLVDSMENNATFHWFKSKLKLLNSDVLTFLNNQINWREDLPEILVNQDTDKTIVEKNRLKRICNNLDQYELLVEDIKQLAKISEPLQNAFHSAIEKHKIELRSEYAKDIEELEKNKEIEKQKFEQTLTKICIEIAHKNKALVDLETKIKERNTHLEHIEENKERILSDFSIIQEVLGNRTTSGKAEKEQIQEESFVMESIIPSQNIISITQRDKFLARLKYFVNQQNINFLQANKLIPICASCQGVFLKTIELGLAFIEAAGNSRYIIQQVEPDWLHFKDLWRNGLGAIWKSSHENPDILHFLILEDINLSSPECYMRPLLDCMNGIRKHIPFAKTAYPNNLRIFATKISSEEPKIGLPLYQQTFKNWGTIGFIGDIDKPVEQYTSIVEGYLEVEAFLSFKSDEPIEDYATKFTDEYKVLFDNQ